METFVSYFQSMDMDFISLLKIGGILLAGVILLSLFGRFVFGKKSGFLDAVSTAIGLLFVYIITAILSSMGAQFEVFIAPLPLVSIAGGQMLLMSFQNADYTIVCKELASMMILSFLVNLADGWLPKGKKILDWLFFRVLTVAIAFMIHLFLSWLFTRFLPEGIITYAPVILLGLLVIMLLTGIMKLVVGALLSTVNPLIGALYTFFFANAVGKQISKSVLTTAILTAIVLVLNHMGCSVIYITPAALIVYIPFALIMIVLWYIVKNTLSY